MEGLRDAARNVEYKGLKSFIDRLNSDNINLLFYYYGQTTPLIFAIGRYDSRQTTVESFNVMIKPILDIKGIDVNEANTNGETALMVAVRENLLTITKMLLKKGADVNKKDAGGRTALMKVKYDNVAMVNALIENKAKINEMDYDGNTALSHYVAYPVGIDYIKTLIEKGADVNSGCYNLKYSRYGIFKSEREYSSSTPLMNVIANTDDDDTENAKSLVELMLTKGADVNSFDSDGKTAIEFCFLRKDWKDLLDVILEYTTTHNIEIERKQYNVYDNDDYYDQLLYLYEKNIMLYNEDQFKRLICSSTDRDEDQKAKDRLLEKMLELGIDKFTGKTPQEKTKDDIIVCAAILGKSDKVEQLLKDGANVNVGFYHKLRNDYNSLTALMCAVEKGNETIVDILLKNKADVDVKADNGWYALSYAIESENIKLVQLLGGKTAGNNRELLMTVVKMFNYEYGYRKFTNSLESFVEFVKIILNIKGVDVNFKNSEGQTPLMYLVKKNTHNSDERLKTISKTAKEIIKSKGVDLNAQDNSGKTALMYFIEENPMFDDDPKYDYNNIILDILTTRSVDVNLRDKDDKTALFYAVIANNSTITEAILKKANVNVKDKDGKTALFYATKDPKMVGLLLPKISVDEKDKDGKTALFYAPPQLIAPLVEGGANVNMQDNLGKTALFCTENKQMASIYYAEMMAKKVEKLLDEGADVNIVDNERNTVIKAIIEKLGDDSSESLGVLMEILKTVPDLDISFKNQKGYNVITYLFSKDLETTRKTKMIDQVLKYCYKNLSQNENLFNHVYEVEYYITYIKNEMKKKKENTEEFENIIGSLEIWKEHVDNRPGSEGARDTLKRLGEMVINYSSKVPRTEKFGGRPRRRSTLRVPLAAFANDFAVSRPAKRRSYIKKKSLAKPATGANLRRRRSKRKTTVRYSPIRKYP
jgi:ankyrin repeat protein